MADRLRLGAKLPSAGPAPAELGVPAMARRLEDAGFDSVWCSDHVVMTESTARSYYPFGDDGTPGWDLDSPWYDALVVMAQAAAVTERVTIGCAVLVVPMRNPIVLAKQLASLDRLSGGRIELGAGAGWYAEEFEALGVDFDRRGPRLDEWLELLRRCWTGRPEAFDGTHHRLPAGVIHQPTPAHHIPILIGGMSGPALRRSAAQDGWLALQRAGHLDPAEITTARARMRELAEGQGRDPDALRTVLRVIESQGRTGDVVAQLGPMREAGVDEVIVDTDWSSADDEVRTFALLAEARDGLSA